MPKAKEKEKGSPFWDFFTSVRLTIAILILLAIASIAGTLIPQREEAARMAHEMSPAMVQLFETLQLFDVYHSFWFRIIIAVLGLNLVICSIDRFPLAWKRFKGSDGLERTAVFKDVPSHRMFSAGAKKDETSSRIAEWFRRHFRRVQAKNGKQEDVFYAEKGRYSHFGVYLVHLSVLFIILGGMIGSFAGFEANVNIPEGDTIDTVFLRRNGHPVQLGFSIQCRSFTAEFYENGAPKEYKSELTFYENGKPVLDTPVLVNHPVTFKGITFYQASYGSMAGDKILLRISKEGSGNEDKLVETGKGEIFSLPGEEGKFVVADVRADFMRLGPAAQIQVQPPSGEPVLFWIFLKHEAIKEMVPGLFEKSPRFNFQAYRPYSFFMQKVETKNYTGLQVNRDPGVSFVWIGCIMMILGFFLTFYSSHRRVWVKVFEKDGKVKVRVVGRSNKNPAGLDRELDRITDSLRNLTQ
ncbi:MAG: cytochrome c biogenesis protein ResB [Desulfobacteraceae bacterium]|nr:MAG: cytochrome c biogenesis protein ResB [Desulfobacteraceae bacterium]